MEEELSISMIRQLGLVEGEAYVPKDSAYGVLGEIEKTLRREIVSSSDIIFRELFRWRVIEGHLVPLVRSAPGTKCSKKAISILALLTTKKIEEEAADAICQRVFLECFVETLFSLETARLCNEAADVQSYNACIKLIRNVLLQRSGVQKDMLVGILHERGFFGYLSVCFCGKNPFLEKQDLLLEIMHGVFDCIDPDSLFEAGSFPSGQRPGLGGRHGRFGGKIQVFEGGRVFDPERDESMLRHEGGFCVTRDVEEVKGLALDRSKRINTRRRMTEKSTRRLSENTKKLFIDIAQLFIENALPWIDSEQFNHGKEMPGSEACFLNVKGFLLRVFLKLKGNFNEPILKHLSVRCFERTLQFIDNKNLEQVFCYETMLLCLIGLLREKGELQRRGVLNARRIISEHNAADVLSAVVIQARLKERRILEGWFNANYTHLLLIRELCRQDFFVYSNQTGGMVDAELMRIKRGWAREVIVDKYVWLMGAWKENKQETNDRLGQFIYHVFQCKREFLFFKLTHFVVFEDVLKMDSKERLCCSVHRIFKAFFSRIRKSPSFVVEPFFGKAQKREKGLVEKMPEKERKDEEEPFVEPDDVLEGALETERRFENRKQEASFLWDNAYDL
eukprot:GHVN01000149.1.p1 GENE.GHVN01000149.1~~GHVN01000149.1.p1  ORF type:complete len:620 (-),score=63.12 GHVN01000149.1:1718-3577(-)